jgi:amino acid adenylation domain-containing protein
MSRHNERMFLSSKRLALLEALLKEEGIESAGNGTHAGPPPLVPVPRTDGLPLSFAQQRLWFLDQLEPGSAAYNVPGALRLCGPLDIAALERSLNAIVARHEALRTSFPTRGSQPHQQIVPTLDVALPVIDLSTVPQATREAVARDHVLRAAQQPFDLAAGPLLRTTLLRLSPEEHVLLVTFHHSIADGWSLGIFIQELTACYAAFVAGQTPALPALPIQYVDYAVWQRTWLQGTVLDEQLGYWRSQLADAPPLLALPTDRPRPPVQIFKGGRYSFNLSQPLRNALVTLSREEGATLFMTLLAAWQALLARYSGQDDIVVGTPIAGRTRAETEGVIGMFVNTLVLRSNLRGQPSFRELVARVREVCLGAYAHQDLPFEQVVEALQPVRSLSYAPLFQVLFALQNAPMPPLTLAGLTLSEVPIESGTAKFDLNLSFQEQADGLAGMIEYNANLFESTTIERMMGHFQALLTAVAADPALPLPKVALLTPAERHQLLSEWNPAPTPFPQDTCLHTLIEAQAARAPHAPAVVAPDTTLSYAELNAQANQLAHHLRALGVGPEVLVGVCLERSSTLVVALLAILKAGGAYVPLDPNYPTARLEAIVAEARLRLVVTHSSVVARLADLSLPGQLCLDTVAAQLAALPQTDPASGVTAAQLAYVLFTSGSTGRPKGVMIQHRSIVNLYGGLYQEIYARHEGRSLRVGLNGSIAFDTSVKQLIQLVGGHTLHIVPQEIRLDAPAMLSFVRSNHLDVFDCTPSQLRLLIEAGLLDPSTQVQADVLVGGEAIEAAMWQQLAEANGVTFYNMYGPTECTVDATICCIRQKQTTPTLGRPIANTQIYVLDRQQAPVPLGVAGEVYIGGAGVARGYLYQPTLTAVQFVPDPFSQVPGARLYRTGDLARFMADGQLEFIGRVDHQIKLRGFRIELSEIEQQLEQHPQVQAVAVMLHEASSGDQRLVAYVASPGENAPSASVLRQFVQQRLPEYMVPSTFVVLEQLPLTPNGKLDRRALPDPSLHDAALMSSFVAPRTPTEETIAGIWAEVLGLEQVGIHDNFFARGGHSLLATQVMSRLNAALAVDLPLRTLFEAPSVAELSREATRRQAAGPALTAPPLVLVPRTEELPLSFAQQRLWFLDQLEPGSAAYNLPGALRLCGPLDVVALERSLNTIVARHEALRTSFPTHDGQPHQQITPTLHVALPVIELSAVPQATREAEVRDHVLREAQQPFDLATGPLLRTAVLRLTPEEHVLLVTLHHSIADGWSLGVFIRELTACYAAFVAGQVPTLPTLPIQYADYAVWQRTWLQGAVLDEQLGYWRSRLADAPPLLALPTDHPRPPVQTFNGAFHAFNIPPQIADAVMAVSAQEDATLFMTLLAAWQALLARYSGQDDIVVGTPIAGRTRAETEDVIGMFVNTLALRSNLRGQPSFRELVARVREVCLGAYAHQDLPFEQVVEALQPARSLSYAPLFQVLFALQNAPMPPFALAGLTLSEVPIESGTAKFDLSLSFLERDDGLAGMIEYNTDLFERATIERMVGHFQALLAAVAADPALPLPQVALLTPAEREQILYTWNATTAPYPHDRCVHELFVEHVIGAPDAVALIYGDDCLTYNELNCRANQLAHHLRALGVGPEVLVGVCLERSSRLIVALLAILKAGGAYVPLDPSYPAARLAFMFEDAQAPVLLTEQQYLNLLPPDTAHLVCIDADWPMIAQRPTTDPVNKAVAGNLAYVMYTSGSSGRPKGTGIPHYAINRLVRNTDYIRLTPQDRVAQVSNTAFDASIFEIWGSLINGARLVGIDKETALSPDAFAALLREQEVTTLLMTTAWFNQITSLLPEAFRSVQYVLIGGEAADPQRIREALEHSKPVRLKNVYGPTESTTFAAQYDIATVAKNATNIPIGYPIANTQLYVLDALLQPVPIGVPGELYIGGHGLAREYYNRPALTAAQFVPDPFGPTPGGRLYRSGDLARYLADGTLEYLGRIDQQVKIRGFRIELGEIEAVLNQHPALREAAVLIHDDLPGGKHIVAYVVLHPGQTPTVAELRDSAREQLPEYMVPSAFVILEQLPLTPNGKLDRRALPAPSLDDTALMSSFVAPRTPTEEAIAGIWAEVLGLEQVGIHDNFFARGGHSLLATQVMSRLNAALAVDLPLRTLFEAPSVAELSREATRRQAAGPALTAPPLVPVPRTEELPLSFAQQRLWFLDQLEPDSSTYNLPGALRLRGPLDIAALERSLNTIVARHEALRTSFPTHHGQPYQQIVPTLQVTLPVIDLSAVPQATREAVARDHALREAQQPFDLATGPLLRTAVLRLTPEEHVLLVTLHHSIADGWSLGVFIRELTACYAAFVAGQTPTLPALPIQYADYAVWQRTWLQGAVLDEQLGYWRSQLADAPPLLALPTDHPRPPVQTFNGALHIFSIPPQVADGVMAVSAQEDATLFMTLLAAWQALLARYSGQDDIVVGTPIAGRTRAETESVIGMFVNTLVLRSNLRGQPSFRELVARVREVCLGAYAHQDLPFEQVVEALQPTRSLSYAPLFQVLFALQNAPMPHLALADLSLEVLEIDSGTTKFDLMLSVEETEQGLMAGLEYNTDLFEGATIERMAGHFQALLAAVVADPALPLPQVALLTPAERHQLLSEWNPAPTPFPQDTCLHTLIEAQAARMPHAPAVVASDTTLSYAELNAQANQLAHHLRALGVGPEVLVGVCLERSSTLVVALLAILKAGGAYVPLDPNYPTARLEAIVAEARLRLVVTHSSVVARLADLSLPGQLCLDTVAAQLAALPQTDPASDVTAAQLAYVLFTSGSTGRPKGVMIPHRAAVNLVHWAHSSFAPSAWTRVLAGTSISFDLSVFELFGTLSAGGIVELVPDVVTLATKVPAPPVTLINTVPSALREIVRVGGVPPSVEVINLAGEPLGLSLVEDAYARTKAQQVYNLYGPTETTTYSTGTLVPRGATTPPRVGRAIANTQIYVLDRQQEPVPLGVAGEVYIGGAGVTRGYLYQPALTAEKFVPDPFSHGCPQGAGTRPGARLYRTGDLARFMPDGQLEFIGRVDHQIKLRGFRIELGEIEQQLEQHPQVQAVVVVVHEATPGDQRLVAYVASPGENAPSASALRQFVQQRLPEYMVPSTFVVLEQLPLTPNGKIDRRALPDPGGARPDLTRTFVAPRTNTEELVASIWAEVLGLKQVGVHDNFFELGGHSLLATRLIARVQEACDVDLPLRTLFVAPTVAGMSEMIEDHQLDQEDEFEEPTHSPLVLIQPNGSKPPFFCIHPSGGRVFCYADLARRLVPDRPFYGIESPGLEDEQDHLTQIEAIAAYYIDLMRTVQPEGPYFLGGWSMGGIVAFEIARQLQAQGQQVALLALLDIRPPASTVTAFDDALHTQRFIEDLATLFGKSPPPLTADLVTLGSNEQLVYILQQMRANDIVPPDFGLAQLRRQIGVYKANSQAMLSYAAQPYPGRVTLFRAEDSLYQAADWERLAAGGLESYLVPGNHYTFLKQPYVHILAQQLQECIVKAEQETQSDASAADGL